METFVSSPKSEKWTAVYFLYDKVLKAKSAKLRGSNTKELLSLDTWFQRELPSSIAERTDKHITHTELTKLMKWKLMRGKFRPRLQQLVETNSTDDVIEASKEAFQSLPDLSSAVKRLTVLKAVGPATASAVLAAGAPAHAPFMADEAMLALPGFQPLQYTLPAYIRFAEQVSIISKRLAEQDPQFRWTPHKVELTLWTYHVGQTLCPDLFGDSLSSPLNSRTSDACCDEPVVKKKKI
ncbi:uncharacterized protein LOC121379279 [Gigantopelta aegis]|uniref:uncharacterized protein LOC121379279 n=1 Tax=Gigantopelta aegis TaxID=1735272 RepID=UPI001B888B77|nr:uncharacterized protein LOC121379279 [Gigantopelta aegis]